MGRTTSRKVESLCLHYYQHQLFIDCLLFEWCRQCWTVLLSAHAGCGRRTVTFFRILLSERWQADIQTPHPLLCSFSFYYPADLQKYLLLLTSSQGTAVGLHPLVFMLWLWLVPQPAPRRQLKHWWSKPWKKNEVWMYPLKKGNEHLFSLYK